MKGFFSMRQNVNKKATDPSDKVSQRSAAARRKKKTKKMSKNTLISLCVVGAVLIGILVFLLTGALTSDKTVVADGVLIDGRDMSGLTRDEVIEQLSAIDNPYKSTSITIKLDGASNKAIINSKDIMLSVDVAKTADRALLYGKYNAFAAIGAKLVKKDIGYAPSYDHLKLDAVLNNFAKEAGGTLTQHEINILEKEIMIHAGHEGLGVDVAKLRKRVLDSLLPGSNETIVVGKVNTTPAAIDVQELYDVTKRDVQDAKYVLRDNDIVIEAEVDGRYFDIDGAKRLLKDFKPGSADVSIPFIVQEAQVKADALSMALFNDVLGSFSTKYMTSNVPRSANVELAAKYINGKILLPGDEFSYNTTVGKRTAERGFRPASVYENNKMVDGLGGGICQTSSTLYAAVLYADLEVVERHEHSLEVSYAPLGMDATVAYGSLDFRFKNNTSSPLKIVSSWGGGTVSVKILGTQENKNKTVKITTQTVSTKPYGTTEIKDATLPVGKTVVDAPGFKGHVVNTYKIIYENGKEVENKFLHKSTYTMVNKVVRIGTGEAEKTDGPAPSSSPLPDGQTPSPSPSSAPVSGDITPDIPFPEGL